MANYNGNHVAYVASSASVGSDLVVLSGAGFSVKVTNITGTAALFFTVSHPGGPCPVPSTSGSVSGTYVLPASAGAAVSVRHTGHVGSIVQATSTTPTAYMVEIQGNHATS